MLLDNISQVLFRVRPYLGSAISNISDNLFSRSKIFLMVFSEEGGVYLDMDVLILKPVGDLRYYQLSLGKEISTDTYLGSGIILAQHHSPFICVWLHAFRQYHPDRQNKGAGGDYPVVTPGVLVRLMPDLVHIEETSLNRPS